VHQSGLSPIESRKKKGLSSRRHKSILPYAPRVTVYIILIWTSLISPGRIGVCVSFASPRNIHDELQIKKTLWLITIQGFC